MYNQDAFKRTFYAHFLSGIIREVTDKVPTALSDLKQGKLPYM